MEVSPEAAAFIETHCLICFAPLVITATFLSFIHSFHCTFSMHHISCFSPGCVGISDQCDISREEMKKHGGVVQLKSHKCNVGNAKI